LHLDADGARRGQPAALPKKAAKKVDSYPHPTHASSLVIRLSLLWP